MDSCQIFNFLFDTKKAKSELSRCFSAFRERVAKDKSGCQSSPKACSRSRKQQPHFKDSPSSAPSSPLKQFRAKISNFSYSTTNLNHRANDSTSQSVAAESIIQPAEDEEFGPPGSSCDEKHSVHDKDINKNDNNSTDVKIECHNIVDPADVSGTYRANLVQSITFDRDLGIISQNSSDQQSRAEQVELGENDDDQLNKLSENGLCQEKQDDVFSPASSIKPLLIGHHDNSQNEANDHIDSSIELEQNDNRNNDDSQMVMKRVILYSGNDDENDDLHPETKRKTSNVCSTAEVFNIVNTDYNYEHIDCNNNYKARDKDDDYNDEDDFQATTNSLSWYDKTNSINQSASITSGTRSSFRERGRSSSLVRTLVQSFEDRTSPSQSLDLSDSPRVSFSTASTVTRDACYVGQVQHPKSQNCNNSHLDDEVSSSSPLPSINKPFNFVKPLPPKAPPKSKRAKCITMQLSLDKPNRLDRLFLDENFLKRFFAHLEPLDRCRAAQVCSQWREVIYSDHRLWSDITIVIDYCQLRRDLVLNCIISTLESVKYSNYQQLRHNNNNTNTTSLNNNHHSTLMMSNTKSPQLTNVINTDHSLYDVTTSSLATTTPSISDRNSNESSSSRESSPSLSELDLDDVWRIQELCNRLANRPFPTTNTDAINNNNQVQQQQFTSQSASIPSQISSTLSSTSLSSLLSPPISHGSLRMDLAKEKLYDSILRRQFDSICLSGPTNEDLEEFLVRFKTKDDKALGRVQSLKLRNTIITDKALTNFLSNLNHIIELELILCNCITNQIDLSSLKRLRSLTIQDCINITDDFAETLVPIASQLENLNIHAYHISDFFPDFLGSNCDMSKLKKLKFPSCRELTDRSLMSIGKFFNSLEILDLSGTKITDDGVDFLANRAPTLKTLDLGWCSNITDASIDFLALDLSESLTELTLDRNVHITDRAMKQLVKMNQLQSLHLRWCLRITDIGIEYLLSIDSLRYLSIAGLHLVTSRSLLKLPQSKLVGIELTNCQAVNLDLIALLSSKMPNCNIT